MFSKLIIRELPKWFKPGNGYAHFPLYVPGTMQEYLRKNGQHVDKYTWERPPRAGMPPSPSPAAVYDARLLQLTKNVKIDRSLVDDILFSSENLTKCGNIMANITRDLIRKKSIYNSSRNCYHVDVVRDVINLAPIYYLCLEILGLPLKTEENPGGIYRDEELRQILVQISEYVFFSHNLPYYYCVLNNRLPVAIPSVMPRRKRSSRSVRRLPGRSR
jgi:linoleate 10R-lipoxygenase